MKVVHVITGLTTGGAEMMLYKLLSHQTNNKPLHDAFVISLTSKGSIGKKIEDLDIPVYALNLKSTKISVGTILFLSRLVTRIAPDIIQGWMYHGNIVSSLIGFFSPRNIKVLWNIRHSLYSLSYEKKSTALFIVFGSMLSKLPNKIVYNSELSREQHEKLGYCPSNGLVLPNGFDTDRFRPSLEYYMEVRHELGISVDSSLVGLISRFHPMKNHSYFFKVARLLLDRSTSDNIYFLLCGREIDRDNNELCKILQALGLSFEKFFFLGERNDIYRLTAALDVATVTSSFGEAFPNVIGEAMSCGVPCVVTNVGDSARIVGDTGKVVVPNDIVGMAQSIESILSLTKMERQELGQKARQRIQENFEINHVFSLYNSLYQASCW